MAQLILTQEEHDATSWLDLSDEDLGRTVRAWVAKCECDNSLQEHERVAGFAAAICMTNRASLEKDGVLCVELEYGTVFAILNE